MSIHPDISPAWDRYVVRTPQEFVTVEPVRYPVIVEQGLRIPMRDGIELAAMVWRPDADGSFPALVERIPMNLETRTGPAGAYYAARGYVVVSIGMRGFSGSEGETSGFFPGATTGDGFDSVEWVAARSWCNGDVGLICGSISGYTAYQTLVEAPPHLKASFVREGAFRPSIGEGGGIALLSLTYIACAWTENQLSYFPTESSKQAQRLVHHWKAELQEAQRRIEPNSPFMAVPEMLTKLPIYPNPLFTGVADYYNKWMVSQDIPLLREQALLEDKVSQVQVPVCHFGAWFDITLWDTLTAYESMRVEAGSRAAREGQRLVIGPWLHGPNATHGNAVGLLEFGPNAMLDFLGFRQRWYDAQIKGKGNVGNDPRVWLYLIGKDSWLGFDEWPPKEIKAIPWYLHNKGLDEKAPIGSEEADSYEYDPYDPIPSLDGGGAYAIGVDQRPIEDRLLTYTSAQLEEELTLVGQIQLVLFAASSALDTDWIVRLTMVRPDGASVIISGGMLRARFRNSLMRQELLTPDRPERFVVRLLPTSIVIPAGHKLRVTVTSSDFPAIDRNLNTGGTISREAEGRVALNTIYHDVEHPSHLLLPVLE